MPLASAAGIRTWGEFPKLPRLISLAGNNIRLLRATVLPPSPIPSLPSVWLQAPLYICFCLQSCHNITLQPGCVPGVLSGLLRHPIHAYKLWGRKGTMWQCVVASDPLNSLAPPYGSKLH